MLRFRWLFFTVIAAAALVAFAATTAAPPPAKAAPATTTTAPAPAKPVSAIPPEVQREINQISADKIRAHVRYLSSDLLEGRGPGTRGDELAINYIAAQFEAAGLKPAGDNGTYIQKVPLIGIATDTANTSLSFTKNGAAVIGPIVDPHTMSLRWT